MKAGNPTLDVINNLHTTHGDFAEKPLPPDALQAILAASVRAASASNMQTYSVEELDALVTEYDNPERRLGLNQDFAKAGHPHYLEWFFKSWAKPFDPAIQPPSAMTHLLRRHGFIHQAEEPKP